MRRSLLFIFVLWLTGDACSPTVNSLPIPNTIIGKWVLVEKQAPGIGPPGVWSPASPAGQWMDIQAGGQISGTVFTDVTGYQVLDSASLKLMAPTQPAGFYLFNYHVDAAARTLFFYIRPTNGGYCIEGCGTYKFVR